ncbi:MAG: hypothetical protein GX076_00470 [Clostridiales bacterium]|nr:hypothetical protein [Clostridiales bacterium]
MKILTIYAGIILAATGIWYFANPGTTFLSVAFVLGVSMLISGIIHIGFYLIFRKRTELILWQLADGILTTVLSILILSNMLVTDGIAIAFFGMWAMYSGVLAITESIGFKRNEISSWFFGIIFGVLSLAAGIYSFVNPLATGFAMALIIGAIFVLQGANSIVAGFQYSKALRSL